MLNHKQSLKEVIRHFLHRTGMNSILLWLRRVRGVKSVDLSEPRTLQDSFRSIYDTGVWLGEGRSSLSGAGSELAAVSTILLRLPDLLAQLDCRHLVDVGCGDLNWMHRILDGAPFEYTGCDIVPSVIERSIAKYATDRIRFRHLDATRDPLPQGDVVLCREVLFHLSFQDIFQLIRNVKTSGARYFITTTENSIWFNSDIVSGDFRSINLRRRPFRFPEPIAEISDDAVRAGRVLAVWPADRLPAH